MDYSNVTAEQLEIALRLCDILSIEDITVACAVLSSLNWDLQV